MVKKSHLQLLLDILYCTQNYKFYYFLETDCEKKIVQYLLRFMYLFFPKISKHDSRKPFNKKPLDSMLYALSLKVYNIPSQFYDLILA